MLTTIKKQLIQEIEELPDELQEKMLKMVHFMKEEIFLESPKKKRSRKKITFANLEDIALDTGIPDLAAQHDHYLYGIPKR